MEARTISSKEMSSFTLTENSAFLRALNSKSGPAKVSSLVYNGERSNVVITGYINEA